MTRYQCHDCGSEDVLQEVSFMVNPNTYCGEIMDMAQAQWEDYFYCNNCEDTCIVEELDNPSDHDKLTREPDDCGHLSFWDDCDHCNWLRKDKNDI